MPKPKPKPKPKPPEKKITWDSVILPEGMKEQIMAAIAQIKNHDRIFKDWGFSSVIEKGAGVTLLFSGLPGTGKTLAAEALAEELGMKCYICNSWSLQSHWVGQMEKNVTEAFRRAKENNEVLLFDEADSLLGNRNYVSQIFRAEINHLLTTLERHDGVVIFTTNRVGDLDPALERRISLKLEFPFPDQETRALIWKRLIPKEAPLGKCVDLKKLAAYPVAGGDIKNIVLNAARTAAYEGADNITVDHFLKAIETEALSKKKFEAARVNADRTPSIADMIMGVMEKKHKSPQTNITD